MAKSRRVARLTRRELLCNGSRCRAAGVVLHETVPHSHGGARRRVARRRTPRAAHTAATTAGTPTSAASVDHARNGFDPHEVLRDFDSGHDDAAARRAASLREFELVAERPGDRGRARRQVRGVDLQRPHPRPDAARPRGRARARHASSTARRTRTRSTSTASTRRRMDGVPGARRRRDRAGRRATVYEFDAEPFGMHLYHCHVRPLADHIAKGLFGAFIIDPKDGRAGRRRARDGHARVRHELRPRERDLRGQRHRLRVHGPADPGQARRARADLPRAT